MSDRVDIDPTLLRFGPLRQLGTADTGVPDALSFRAAYQKRFAGALVCIVMALVGACLVLTVLKPQTMPMRLLSVAAVGYAIHLVTTTLTLLGENGLLTLLTSAWVWPASLTIGALAFLYGFDQRVQYNIGEGACMVQDGSGTI